MTNAFHGFSPQATSFFADLDKNNSKNWFEKNRKTFESDVKEPFAALLDRLPKLHKPFKVFRLNRDTRFSQNKSPYKLMHGAAHTRAGGSVEYLHIDKQGLLLAAGHYVMEPEQLKQFRAALLDPGEQKSFKTMLARLKTKGVDLEPGGSAPLKTAPRGVPLDSPTIEWLRWKGCVAMTRIPNAELDNGAAVVAKISKWYKLVEPLNIWLDRNIR
jgi:uncharacterized protein (TIGR02453 family)